MQGEGEWWRATEQGFEFLDTDNQQCVRPTLQHYRTSGFLDVKAVKAEAWQNIRSNTLLPTPSIKIYDEDGHFVSRKTFIISADNSNNTTEVPMDITHNADESSEQNVDEASDITSVSANECDNEYTHTVCSPPDLPMSLNEAASEQHSVTLLQQQPTEATCCTSTIPQPVKYSESALVNRMVRSLSHGCFRLKTDIMPARSKFLIT